MKEQKQSTPYVLRLISKDEFYLGIVESNRGIVACNCPTKDRTVAVKTLRDVAERLKLDFDSSFKESSDHSVYSETIFKLAEQPKKNWSEALKVPIDYTLYTPKQQKVVETLRNLNPGQIITYGELAELSGFPRAARFVGSTMAKNYVPLVVPCHRVVPASKKLGKYSGGGPEVKRRLLKFEGIDI